MRSLPHSWSTTQTHNITKPMRLKVFKKKLTGYYILKEIAILKGFWDDIKQEAVIPEGYTVETDGILWSIRLSSDGEQG